MQRQFPLGPVRWASVLCMSTMIQVAKLRATAGRLRSVSAQIGTCRALTVCNLAGPDTWVGPTAQSCYDALLAVRRQLQTDEQTLLDSARRLDRQADAIEQQPPILKLLS
jgi:hypothetical protein